MKTTPTDIDPTTLVTLTANYAGGVRREVVDGRVKWVAPATILVPGVLNGSRGRLYYPPDEVAANVGVWNGVKGPVNHPTKTDEVGKTVHVSVNDPSVPAESVIAVLRNDRVEGGNRRVDVVFDEELTKNYDKSLPAEHAIFPRISTGRPVELSTGLFTDNTPVTNDETAKGLNKCPRTGREYDAVARNYRPDHLAILPTVKGACSVKDGCGVNNVEAGTTTETPTTNCDSDHQCGPCVVKEKVAARKRISSLVGNGRWVTLDGGQRLYLEGGKLSTSPGGKVVSGGKKGGKGSADKPDKGKKETIQSAAKALSAKGYSLKPAGHDLKSGETYYHVTGKDGKTEKKSAAEVKRMIRNSVSALVGNFGPAKRKGCNQYTKGRCSRTVYDPNAKPNLVNRIKKLLGFSKLSSPNRKSAKTYDRPDRKAVKGSSYRDHGLNRK